MLCNPLHWEKTTGWLYRRTTHELLILEVISLIYCLPLLLKPHSSFAHITDSESWIQNLVSYVPFNILIWHNFLLWECTHSKVWASVLVHLNFNSTQLFSSKPCWIFFFSFFFAVNIPWPPGEGKTVNKAECRRMFSQSVQYENYIIHTGIRLMTGIQILCMQVCSQL